MQCSKRGVCINNGRQSQSEEGTTVNDNDERKLQCVSHLIPLSIILVISTQRVEATLLLHKQRAVKNAAFEGSAAPACSKLHTTS
jgi:hypothetical protein